MISLVLGLLLLISTSVGTRTDLIVHQDIRVLRSGFDFGYEVPIPSFSFNSSPDTPCTRLCMVVVHLFFCATNGYGDVMYHITNLLANAHLQRR